MKTICIHEMYILPNSMEKSFFSEANSSRLFKKCPIFCWTWRFVITFTRAIHTFLSWARRIQLTLSHLVSLRSILILSSHLCPDLSRGLFHPGYPTKTLCAFSPCMSPNLLTSGTKNVLTSLWGCQNIPDSSTDSVVLSLIKVLHVVGYDYSGIWF